MSYTLTVTMSVMPSNGMSKEDVIAEAMRQLPDLLDGTDFMGVEVIDAEQDDVMGDLDEDGDMKPWGGFKKAKFGDANGTHLQGYVDVSFDRLMEVFGEPHSDGDGYKIDAEWTLITPAGVATIYNYKDGINYNGEAGTPTVKITDWHIGGHNKEVVELIQKALA